jgi:hypothetical protein
MLRKIQKIVPALTILLTALLTLTILTVPVSATGAHLWFYSVDPLELGYPPLVNPKGNDPNYVDVTSDPWTTESVVLSQGNWDNPFNLWIGNADPYDTSYNTMLVISVNNAAAGVIPLINVTPEDGTTVEVRTWTRVPPSPKPLGYHGVFNSAEWYGCAIVNVGNIASGGYKKVEINIDLNSTVPENAKIHFDAYGWSNQGDVGDLTKADITSPFSHDYTFVIPELATILLTMAPLSALGIYAYRRKSK